MQIKETVDAMLDDSWLTLRRKRQQDEPSFKPNMIISRCFNRSFFSQDVFKQSLARKLSFLTSLAGSDLSAPWSHIKEHQVSGGDIAAYFDHASSGLLDAYPTSPDNIALYPSSVSVSIAASPITDSTLDYT